MAAPELSRRPEEASGRRRIALGGGFGLAGALVGVLVPIALLFLATYGGLSYLPLGATFWEVAGLLVAVGGALLAVSFLLYRFAFRVLAKIDRGFLVASLLCLIGTVGLLLIAVAAGVLAGSTGALVGCLHGQPTRLLSCARSGPTQGLLGAYAGFAGLALAWLGGVGIVLGLWWEGTRTRARSLRAGGLAYGLLLVAIAGPLAELLVPFAGGPYLVLAVPGLLMLAPAFVVAGSRS